MNRKSICVYCASSDRIDAAFFQEAQTLGRLIAQSGITLINGAGSMGLMRATTDACLEAGGTAIGIIPTFMIRSGWCHTRMTEIVGTPDMHLRQQKMAEMSDAAIVLPGGCGTFAELMELIVWKQLGLYLKPIVILNVNGYFDALLRMMQEAADKNFLRKQHTKLWCVADNAEEALDLALSTPLWDTSIQRFTAK